MPPVYESRLVLHHVMLVNHIHELRCYHYRRHARMHRYHSHLHDLGFSVEAQMHFELGRLFPWAIPVSGAIFC
jgi:hypothetical protein